MSIQDSNILKDLVSTIIPVFNRPAMLTAAADSVLAQSYRPIEIIIADDGSTDETPTVARRLVAEHPEIIRYFRHENAGPGPARELGRINANGEFIQYLDSDDRLLPNKFTDQVAVLREHPECDIAYGITRLVNSNGETLADPFKWTAKQIPELFPGLLVDRWWCTHTPLYRRTLTDRIGPWTAMRWSQDWEYDSRAGAANTKLISCRSHVSEHVHHDSDRQTSAGSTIWQTDPIRLDNRHELLTALWKASLSAGVAANVPERQHFARWCFSVARQQAAQGMKSQALSSLEIAIDSAGRGSGRRGIAPFRTAVHLLGPRNAAKLFSLVKPNTGNAGESTLEQSFS